MHLKYWYCIQLCVFFAETCCNGLGLEQERSSLVLLCQILDLISIVKKGFGTKRMVEMLRDVMSTHLHGFLECCGADAGVPKNHFSAHMPEQWIENRMKWLDCWPMSENTGLFCGILLIRTTPSHLRKVGWSTIWYVFGIMYEYAMCG